MKRLFQAALLLLCLSTFVISCENKKNMPEGYEWMEGKWTLYDSWMGCQLGLNITPSYVQFFKDDGADWSGPREVDFSNIEKQKYTIDTAYHIGTDGKLLAICTDGGEDDPDPIAFIDKEEKSLYDFYDFSERMDYEKVIEGQKVETTEDAKVVKEKEKETETKAKIKGSNKLFTKAFAEKDALVFDTGFAISDAKIYLVLHPFVFSEDKMEGKAFFIRFEEDTNYNVYRVLLRFWGDYQIIGDYFRFFNAFDHGFKSDEPIFDRIYTISEDSYDGSLQLRGKFPKQEDEASMRLTDMPSDQLRVIDNFLDNGLWSCMYK